jgi:hypothetical protein
MSNEKKAIKYEYHEINQDMKNNKEELQSLLKKWIDSEPSELRTRLIIELNNELNNN